MCSFCWLCGAALVTVAVLIWCACLAAGRADRSREEVVRPE